MNVTSVQQGVRAPYFRLQFRLRFSALEAMDKDKQRPSFVPF